MNIAEVNRTHRIAQNDDLPRICYALKNNSEHILVRDMYRNIIFPLTEVSFGDYIINQTGDRFVLSGHDKKTGKPALLKIESLGVVYLKNHLFVEWTRVSKGGVRIMIPKDF